jgi:hypothetical protein
MHPARELARSFLRRHDLRPPVSYARLVEAADRDGVQVIVTTEPLHGRGYCVGLPGGPIIVLRFEFEGSAWVLAHELGHALNIHCLNDLLEVRAFGGEEPFCEAFAGCIAGSALEDIDP